MKNPERKLWTEVAPEVPDEPAAVELLRTWVWTAITLRALEDWLTAHGTTTTYQTGHGAIRHQPVPQFDQARALRAQLATLSDSLSLSPRARGAAEVTDDEADDTTNPLADVRSLREARLRKHGAAG